MRKTIYLAIIEALKQGKVGVKHISLWNDNTTALEQERGFSTPAVFIEFMPFRWSQKMAGVKNTTAEIRLHIVLEALCEPSDGSTTQRQALEIFDFLDSVTSSISGVSSKNFTRLQHNESITDHNYDVLQHHIEVFKSEITDISGLKPFSTTTIENLEIKRD